MLALNGTYLLNISYLIIFKINFLSSTFSINIQFNQ